MEFFRTLMFVINTSFTGFLLGAGIAKFFYFKNYKTAAILFLGSAVLYLIGHMVETIDRY